MSGSPKTEEKECRPTPLKPAQARQGPALVVIRHTLPGGVYQLQQEVIGGAKFRDCSIVVTGKYFSGLNHKPIESKWPGYLNFLTEGACNQ